MSTDPTPTLAGRIAWTELVTPDPARAVAFYTALLGWSAREQDMGMDEPYRLLHHDGLDRDTAGVMRSPPDTPPHWATYLTVDDVDASLARLQELGGQALTEAMSVPGVGRFAVVADPAGAVFSLFRGEDPVDPSVVETPPDRTFCWAQLMVKDVDAAAAFYADLLGWTVERMPGGIAVFSDAHAARASAMPMPAELDAPAHWLNYIAAHDIDGVTARVEELGGSVMKEPTDMPGMGRFSVLVDPTGAAVALWRDVSVEG